MNQLSAANIYASAEAHFLAGNLQLASEELHCALKADSDAGELWELLGMITYSEGDWKMAIHALENASLLVPLANCSQYILAACYGKQGLVGPAVAIYGFLATRKQLDDNMLEPLARALGRSEDFEAALKVCREAASRFPESPEPLMGMVCYMRQLGRPAKQILPCLFRAHHLNPEDLDCRKMLAWILHANGHSDDAAALLSVIPIEEHQCGNCLTGMQSVFTAAKDYANAKRCADALQSFY